MMNLLITGALGFVGINLVRTLAAKEDVRVVAADRHAPDAIQRRFLTSVATQVEFVTLDVTARADLRALVADVAITHIIHGAAITPSHSQEQFQTTSVVDVNVGGAVNMLDAAIASPRVERLLFLSSSGVYGLSSQVPGGQIREDARLVLDNLYAITKRSVELLTARYGTLHDKPMASVRLGPIYGPMERTSATRARLSAPGQLLQALQTSSHAVIRGADVTRDWTYAGDIGEAVWALLSAKDWRHDVYNVSYGRPVTLRELVQACAVQGLEVTTDRGPNVVEIGMLPTQTRTPMAVERLVCDSGYRPATTPAQGMEQSIIIDVAKT